ncbi:hypothetical protein ACFO8O_07010 [Hephaestia sp. GCM10023244]|uniref:hypothetical protein n=1 Tax=unclassified Hephaestia TaxID=2631281 RepID=UPI002077153B|nr:hypothetical protein [Hephaestia sp. MAHUQ-44]MCM8730718.1 hypothetical protein [Hephaestia sp. MAHUQ-44]
MTATHRLKGMGWFLACVIGALGFYLISLQVATERNKLEIMNREIAQARHDIRSLQTEFSARSNLAQLERWNGEVLALSAPTSAQFVSSEAQLAALDFNGPGGTEIQTAQLVIPNAAPLRNAVVSPVEAMPGPVVMAANAPVAVAPQAVARTKVAEPAPHIVKAVAVHADTSGIKAAPARAKAEAVAMLDRKLLSDSTLGDIVAGARAERRAR